jgi:teichuronic acid biosynthesis glycosyltransferase TuaC
MRLLTFSTLYPNAANPSHGVFVETRLRQLLATGEVSARVVAPVPYFPSTHPRFGAWARHAAAPKVERRFGIDIAHPRYLAIPRVGMSLAPYLLYAGAAPAIARMIRGGDRFDGIDAHYLYPDGVAAVWLGRRFGLPVVLTARGSDVTQWPGHVVPRRLILRACGDAAAIITVSTGLRDALSALGVPPARITVLRNGVDLEQFSPRDRDTARARLGLSGPALLSVGGLIPRKGHDLTIRALPALPGWTLLIAGEGPERNALRALAEQLGVADRVRLLGAWPHGDLASLYSAADISCLSSSREGMANVLLESMACGTPVVASPIPGNDEAVRSRAGGVIAEARTPEAIAAAVRDLFRNRPERDATRAYACGFGWEPTSRGQIDLLSRITAKK